MGSLLTGNLQKTRRDPRAGKKLYNLTVSHALTFNHKSPSLTGGAFVI